MFVNRTRTPAANMGLSSHGVTCLNSSIVFQINRSVGMTVLCPEIPHQHQARKSYGQPYLTADQTKTDKCQKHL